MTDPSKHRRAEPERTARRTRASRPARSRGTRIKQAAPEQQPSGVTAVLGRLRTIPGMIAFAVLVIGLAVVVRLAVAEDEPAAARSVIPGAVNGTYGTQWTTVDGGSYEIAIETLSDLGQGQSASGCLPTPPAGSANLSFRIILTNRGTEEAPVPRVLFGTDLTRAGGVDPARQAFAKSNKALEIVPLVGVRDCRAGAQLGEARGTIPAGGAVEFRATFGPVKVPVRTVPTVVYRYYANDGGTPAPTDLLAPFTAF